MRSDPTPVTRWDMRCAHFVAGTLGLVWCAATLIILGQHLGLLHLKLARPRNPEKSPYATQSKVEKVHALRSISPASPAPLRTPRTVCPCHEKFTRGSLGQALGFASDSGRPLLYRAWTPQEAAKTILRGGQSSGQNQGGLSFLALLSPRHCFQPSQAAS